MGWKIWLLAIGIVFIIEGTPYLVAPGGMKRLLAQVLGTPEAGLRVFGVLAVTTGFAILLWCRFSS